MREEEKIMVFNYKTLKEHVYLYLYEKINSGTIKPKEKINESQLCKDINVSRTPIREALIQLEDEGYIERLPRRGFIVKEISLGKIKEIFQILGCLEGFAASLTIDKLTDKDIEEMRALVKKMDEAIADKKVPDYFRLQRNFHNIYISVCGNNELFDLIASLKKRFVKKAYFLSENKGILYEPLNLQWISLK
jgi:DNA-binding GntR family transcriptional regulator